MATENRTILEETGVMNRGRAVDRGQDKAVLGIHGCVLLEAEVGHLVFDGPVAFQITREFQRLAIFILLTFFSIALRTFLFQIIIAHGSLADSTRRASTATPSLMESPLASNWRRISEFYPVNSLQL